MIYDIVHYRPSLTNEEISVSNWFDEFKVNGQKRAEEIQEGDLFIIGDGDENLPVSESVVYYIVEALDNPRESGSTAPTCVAISFKTLWSFSERTQGAPTEGSFERGRMYYTVIRRG